MAVFPNSIFPWTPVVDNVTVITADMENSLADEIIAIEEVIATTPHVEPQPPVTINQITVYENIDLRISSCANNFYMPHCRARGQRFHCGENQQVWLGFQADIDTNGYFNGTDVTIQGDGVHNIVVTAQFLGGTSATDFAVIDVYINEELIGHCPANDWQFMPSVRGSNNPDLDSWNHCHVNWHGPCHKGDRIRCRATCGVGGGADIDNHSISCTMHRSLNDFNGGFASG